MAIQDNRHLTSLEQYEIRRKIVTLRESRLSIAKIAKATGYSTKQINSILQQYQDGGHDALEPKKRGPKTSTTRILNGTQENKVRKYLLKKTPDQLELGCCLWTKDAVQQAIMQNTKIDIPLRTISDYLSRWGFTFQNPNKSGRERNRRTFDLWRETEYPEILSRSKKEGSEIYWGECSSNKEDSDYKILSAVSNRGQVRFMSYRGTLTENKFKKFLVKLRDDSGRKVLLILYKNKVYKNESLFAWLDTPGLNIDLYYLEGYY